MHTGKMEKVETPWHLPAFRELIEDFVPGPLDAYRKKTSFDWKEMKLHFFGKDMIEFENRVWKTLEDDPLFQPKPVGNMSLQEARQLCFQRMKRVKEYKFCSDEEFFQNPLTALNLYICVGMIDWSLSLKLLLGIEYFILVLILSGKEKQWEFANEVRSFNVIGCFALTEMAHGTNTRGVQTTATFDKQSQMFVINTPTLEATKMWIGNLGQTATYAVLYAQLYTSDGQCHGLHAFLVPIRDPVTHQPYPGVTVGDMGPKLGLKGLDNGFMSFQNYKVPRESLLSRHGEVTTDGKYLTAIKDPKKRFGLSMGSLSLGRMGILTVGISNLRLCLPIAVRYAAVRKQFGPPGGEIPILEYQLHQYRILPYLAATYTLYHFVSRYNADLMELQLKFAYSFEKKDQKVFDQAGELHALCSAAKPLITWTARDAIQECREACGGHGYLEASGFGRLRNDNDANCTYEGDNNVLLQQTSNYLLGLLKKKRNSGCKFSHMQSVSFLDSIDGILEKKCCANIVGDCMNMKTILGTYEWLVCYLLERSSHEFERLKNETQNDFYAKNNSQIFFCKDLSMAFIEHAVLQKFEVFINETEDVQIASTLHRLGCLYGLWSLQKYYAVLHEGGFCERRTDSTLMKQAILQLCYEIKDDAVALVDVVAPPDYVLNSALGKSDGEVYKNLHNAIIQTPGSLERAPWWHEFKQKPKVFSIAAKL